jgi:hypothetical protein
LIGVAESAERKMEVDKVSELVLLTNVHLLNVFGILTAVENEEES